MRCVNTRVQRTRFEIPQSRPTQAILTLANPPIQIAIHTIHKGCPPIVFVGTRKDIVSSPVVHGEISAALDKAFSSHPVWPFVHHDVHGKTGTSGTTTTRLTFFAVNNVKGRGDPVVLRLLNVMQVYAFNEETFIVPPPHTSSLLPPGV